MSAEIQRLGLILSTRTTQNIKYKPFNSSRTKILHKTRSFRTPCSQINSLAVFANHQTHPPFSNRALLCWRITLMFGKRLVSGAVRAAVQVISSYTHAQSWLGPGFPLPAQQRHLAYRYKRTHTPGTQDANIRRHSIGGKLLDLKKSTIERSPNLVIEQGIRIIHILKILKRAVLWLHAQVQKHEISSQGNGLFRTKKLYSNLKFQQWYKNVT